MTTVGDVISELNKYVVTYLTATSEMISEKYNICLVNEEAQAKTVLNENSKMELFYVFKTENLLHAKSLVNEVYDALDTKELNGRILNIPELNGVDYNKDLLLIVHRQQKFAE